MFKDNNPRFIVKVQVPIVSTGEDLALIYTVGRVIEVQVPITDDIRKLMGSEYKKYVWAHLEGTILHLDEEAPWQSW